MKLIFEMNFGYVSCDIHGDGYNRIWVYRDDGDWTEPQTRWRATLSSRCYGDEEKLSLSAEELVEFMESKRFFVATRTARRNFNRFVEGMRRGKFDKTSVEDHTRVAQQVPEPANWSITLDPEPFVCHDVCCNPQPDYELLNEDLF